MLWSSDFLNKVIKYIIRRHKKLSLNISFRIKTNNDVIHRTTEKHTHARG